MDGPWLTNKNMLLSLVVTSITLLYAYSIHLDNNTVDVYGVIQSQFGRWDNKVPMAKRSSFPFQEAIPTTLKKDDLTLINMENISCQKLFNGDRNELDKAKVYQKQHPKIQISLEAYTNLLQNCSTFKDSRGYIQHSTSESESNFPLAFAILMYKDVEQVERLLRAIYRPQNVYCLHIDAKANDNVKKTLSSLAACFSNVILPSNPISVNWGDYTVVAAHITCMKELLKYSWKYFINLTGQEFPLRTNAELVKIFKIYNGTNDMLGKNPSNSMKLRYRYIHKKLKPTKIKKSEPPHKISIVKGEVHLAVNRDYVEFVVNDKKAKDFLQWCKDIHVPDEMYFTSLNYNKHLDIPGSFPGKYVTKYGIVSSLTRVKRWIGAKMPCYGKIHRELCIFSVKDLPNIVDKPHMFLNKLHLDYNHLVLDCLEERYFSRLHLEHTGSSSFNKEPYEKFANFHQSHLH